MTAQKIKAFSCIFFKSTIFDLSSYEVSKDVVILFWKVTIPIYHGFLITRDKKILGAF